MAGSKEVRCVGPSYSLADRKTAVQRSINLQLKQIEAAGEAEQYVLTSSPGITGIKGYGSEIRGLHRTSGSAFVVVGNELREITSSLPLNDILRGNLVTATGFVSMDENESQLVLVDGPNGYVLDLATNVFSQITDPYFRGSDWVENIDGYFVFNAPDTNQFYLSAIDDATTGDALDFSSIDAVADSLVTHRVLKHELVLFGKIHTEFWVNNGGSDFPFSRYTSIAVDIGIAGVRAAVRTIDSIVFVGNTLGGSRYVYSMDGHQPIRISTRAVEEALESSTDITQCSLYTYQQSAAEYVCINAPGMETTWVYDIAIKQWHERAELLPDGSWGPLRIDQLLYVDGRNIGSGVGLSGSWSLYIMSETLKTITGNPLAGEVGPLARERTWPHLKAPSYEPVSYHGLELMCTTGQDVATPANITLEVSNDGGFTWNAPLLRSLGAVGRYMQRVRWLGLGASRDRVFRLRCTDAVDLTIQGAVLDVSGG